jgi:hypothetical protein
VDNKKTVSWYIAGTPTNWQGVPLVIVVALEDSSANAAEKIGQALINKIFIQ